MGIWLQGNLDAHPFISQDYWISNLPAVKAATKQTKVHYAVNARGKFQDFIGMQNDDIAGIFVTSQAQGNILERPIAKKYQKLIFHVYLKNSYALSSILTTVLLLLIILIKKL